MPSVDTAPSSRTAAPPPQQSPQHDAFAQSLRSFGPIGIFAILLIALSGNFYLIGIVVPVGAILVLLWVVLSHTPWREIGYVRPKNWPLTIASGIVFGSALKFTMKALVMPLLGADPINWSFHYLTGNRAQLPFAIWMMLVAGFGEETVFRGFAFERFTKAFGSGAATKFAAVVLTSIWFASAHYRGQGIPGTEQALIVGLIFATIFARTRSIAFLMIAHAAFDLTALIMIYFNAETRIAHLIFH
ncbi:MAG TPA: type II CAAX endopeptidase family protein [Candidatus Acidoferrales bacterium]|nr:type II CAAX endopeptidase family protein [Candidatus Acidoferrales bacterium]